VAASDWLVEAAAQLGLELGIMSNPGPTHIPRDTAKHPSAIDLVFLLVELTATTITEHVIEDTMDLDHHPLLTCLPISSALQQASRKCVLSKPKKIKAYLNDLIAKIQLIEPNNQADTPDSVEAAAKAVANTFSAAWQTHSRRSNIMQCSRPWWDNACAATLQKHCNTCKASD
jgi:hypothetical protein